VKAGRAPICNFSIVYCLESSKLKLQHVLVIQMIKGGRKLAVDVREPDPFHFTVYSSSSLRVSEVGALALYYRSGLC
jgi:hypothetical protein